MKRLSLSDPRYLGQGEQLAVREARAMSKLEHVRNQIYIELKLTWRVGKHHTTLWGLL